MYINLNKQKENFIKVNIILIEVECAYSYYVS